MTAPQTISELMEGKRPGEIKIASPHLKQTVWFQPYFTDKNKHWHGISYLGDSQRWEGHIADWQIYVEPKKKKIMYQYAFKRQNGSWEVDPYFMDADAYDENNDWTKRLDYTATEFEVE